MQKFMINKAFPAEHPYHSHMSKYAMFPSYDVPEDPVKGVHARSQVPKSAETPSNPYDVTVVSKTKGE